MTLETIDNTGCSLGCVGSYSIKVACTNCDWSGQMMLTKGHEFDRHRHRCPTCNTPRLRKAREE